VFGGNSGPVGMMKRRCIYTCTHTHTLYIYIINTGHFEWLKRKYKITENISSFIDRVKRGRGAAVTWWPTIRNSWEREEKNRYSAFGNPNCVESDEKLCTHRRAIGFRRRFFIWKTKIVIRTRTTGDGVYFLSEQWKLSITRWEGGARVVLRENRLCAGLCTRRRDDIFSAYFIYLTNLISEDLIFRPAAMH